MYLLVTFTTTIRAHPPIFCYNNDNMLAVMSFKESRHLRKRNQGLLATDGSDCWLRLGASPKWFVEIGHELRASIAELSEESLFQLLYAAFVVL